MGHCTKTQKLKCAPDDPTPMKYAEAFFTFPSSILSMSGGSAAYSGNALCNGGIVFDSYMNTNISASTPLTSNVSNIQEAPEWAAQNLCSASITRELASPPTWTRTMRVAQTAAPVRTPPTAAPWMATAMPMTILIMDIILLKI